MNALIALLLSASIAAGFGYKAMSRDFNADTNASAKANDNSALKVDLSSTNSGSADLHI